MRVLKKLFPGPVVAKSATRQLRKLVTEEPQPSVGTIKAGTYMLKDTLTAVEGINYVQDTEIIDIETVECELNGNPLIFTGIVIPATYDNSNNVSLKAIDISEGENYPRDFVIYQNYWHSSLQNIKTFTITKDTETKYYDWFIANATKVESTVINFTANDVSLQATEGQTWREWVATANNTAGYSIKEILYQGTTSEYVVVTSTDNQYTVLDGKDDFVRPDDKIIDGRTYPTYTLTADVIPDIWILNDTLTPYAGSANLTVSDIEGTFYSRTGLYDNTLIEHPIGSITLCVNPQYSSDTILNIVSSDATPYAKTQYLNNDSKWHSSYYGETGNSAGGYINDAADLVKVKTLAITKYPDSEEFMDWLEDNARKQGDEPTTIAFTIGSNSYTVDKGATWEDWVRVTDLEITDDGHIRISSDGIYYFVARNGSTVKSTDTIIEGASYHWTDSEWIGTWYVNDEVTERSETKSFAIEGAFYVIDMDNLAFVAEPLVAIKFSNKTMTLVSDVSMTDKDVKLENRYYMYASTGSGADPDWCIYTQWLNDFSIVPQTNVNAPTLRTFKITGGADINNPEFVACLKANATKQ